MPVTMKDLGIDRLSPADRVALAQEIWDSINDENDLPPLDETQRREIDRRLEAHAANPNAAIPWEQVEAEALARLRR
ncbi:MAG: addiction module protein [Gemmataceae bacterium]|nr:addiction module protein [Gemmataceae bacterium]